MDFAELNLENKKCPKCNSRDTEIKREFKSDDYTEYVTEYLVCNDCCYVENLGCSYS